MKSLILVTLISSAFASLPAQTAATTTSGVGDAVLTPEQTATILKQLDTVESLIGKNRGDIMNMALTRFSKAVAAGESGALQLYMDCYRLEHIERKNMKVSDFQEWAKKNIDKHKDPEFLIGLWLQLEYLTLTIRAQDAKEKDTPALVSSLQVFLNKVITTIQSASNHSKGNADTGKSKGNKNSSGQSFDSGKLLQMLRQSVKNTEFARAYQLELFLNREDWAYDPVDFKSVYDKIILPYYAEVKPAELPAQWDNRIKSELCIKAATMSETEYNAFLKEHLPEMHWRKAEYLIAHNSHKIQSIADMLKLIRENPMHPDAAGWARRLREIVTISQPPGGPSATDSTTVDTPPAGTN